VSTSSKDGAAAHDYRITPKSSWAGSWKIAAGIGAAGLAVAAYGYFGKVVPADRFALSYLFGLWVSLSLALGSLFFVMVQFVTKANWGVTVRRVAEMFMRPMPIFAILIIPLVLLLPQIFPWLGAKHPATSPDVSAEHAAKPDESPVLDARGDINKEPAAYRDMPYAHPKQIEGAEEHEEKKIVDHKRFYLNKYFFLGRLIAFLLIWAWLAQKYFTWSTDQDKTKALENTAAAQRFAPAGLMLFAVTITFFCFDWLLSINSTWFSTIFGVQCFAQAALFNMAALILTALALRRSGILGDAVNVEHFHDMGKLLFGWIAFWSYISFAQFFLTWYSNIPDELTFFHLRWHDNGGTWKGVTLAIVLMHFFVPFWFLMSRNIKRRLPLLAIGALCMVVMHVVESYWLVMAAYGPLAPNFVDLACLVGLFGVYASAVLRGMEDFAMVPVGDPRLERALHFENA
jgi:MFS family permease